MISAFSTPVIETGGRHRFGWWEERFPTAPGGAPDIAARDPD